MTDRPLLPMVLVLGPDGSGPPVEIRVRRLLKAALRSFGLRCVTFHAPTDADLAAVGLQRAPSPPPSLSADSPNPVP